MLITHEFIMDLDRRGVTPLIHAVQGDSNTRAVKVTLTARGAAFALPGNVTASVAFRKADGKKGWYDTLPDGTAACTIAENAVTAILAPEMLTAAGLVESLVILQNENLDQLATFCFVVQVEKNPAFGVSISNDYYNYSNLAEVNMALDTLFAKVSEIDKTLNGGETEIIGETKYIDGETCAGFTTVGSTTWTDYRNNLIIVPVKSEDVVEIGSSDAYDTYLYFLKTYKEPVVGETIDFTTYRAPYENEAEGKTGLMASTGRCHVPAGKTYKITVPEDTTCILVYTACKSIKVNGSEYPVTVIGGDGGLVKKVNENSDQIKVLVENTRINIDNPYVRAYLMNTQYSTDEWDETNGHPYYTREDVSAYSQYVEGGKDKATPIIVNIEPYDGALSYKILVSENPLYTNAKELSATTGANKISWLKINRVYWVKAIATTADGDVVLSEKAIETNGVRRLNPLTSVQNMRDLGGQKTVDGKLLKQGLLYRSGRLMWIAAEDVGLLENVLDIKLVVGFAQNTEDERIFSDNVETYNATQAGFGLPNGWDTLNTVVTRQQYITYLRKIIEYLSQGKAVLYHCNGGADRTGLMSALIEGLCGVSENDICKDYELTSFSIESGTTETGNPKMLSRTRLGSKNEDGTYTSKGFDSGIWVVRQQSGCETYADQWKKLFQKSDLAVDGFEPLKDEEIEALRKALIVEK